MKAFWFVVLGLWIFFFLLKIFIETQPDNREPIFSVIQTPPPPGFSILNVLRKVHVLDTEAQIFNTFELLFAYFDFNTNKRKKHGE